MIRVGPLQGVQVVPTQAVLAISIMCSSVAAGSGPRYPGPHLRRGQLVLSVIALAAAYRFDSRVVLSLALSSFAAWRGLSTRLPLESHLAQRPGQVRANALACGVLFLAAAFVSRYSAAAPVTSTV